MKKIIGLSVTICLLISVMAGFGAFAADDSISTIYDIDFDSWAINVKATDVDALNTLNGVLAAKTNDKWSVTKADNFAGNAAVSTVAVEGRGNVLKISGTDLDEATSSTSTTDSNLIINVPLVDNYTKADTYKNDKLYIEYDLFIPSLGDKSNSFIRFYYNILGANEYSAVTHSKNTNSFVANSYVATQLKEDNYTTSTSDYKKYTSPVELGSWYRMQYVLDMYDTTPVTIKNSEGTEVSLSGLRTFTTNTKNLSTNETTSDIVPLDTTKLTDYLSIGSAWGAKRFYGEFYIDNVNIYTRNKFAFESSADDEATNIAYDKKSVSFTMNAPVKADSLSGITLKAGAKTVSTTAAVSTSDNKKVVVTIGEELDYSTTYTLDFASVLRNDGEAIDGSDVKSITFTTQAAPALYVAESKIYNGSDVFMTDAASISADGGLYTFAAKVKSSVGESKQATAIVGVYDANGKLVSASFIGKNIPALSEEIIAAGTTIPASLAGGTVKMFLWNNVNKMQPYVKPLVENID